MSVFLGVVGLGAVLTLHFPEVLSSAELRARYPMDAVRLLIDATIAVAFVAACVSALLRRRKVLGVTGAGLALLAALLGGGRVEITGPVDGELYLGLDWLLWNVLVLALVFVPLERAFPLRPAQSPFRFGWTTDLMFFFVSHVAVQVLTFATLLPATSVSAILGRPAAVAWIAEQPVWLQVIEIMLLADLAQYWAHRAFHRVPWLWRFHAVHHSARAMDWLAGSRLHPVDAVATRAVVLVPLFVLGFHMLALTTWLALVAFHAIFDHGNLRFRFRGIEHVLATPRFHHWHHAVAPVDKNFSVHFPWLDRLFGTHYMPADGAWPDELGIEGHPVPEGLLPQLAHPFRAQSPERDA